MIACWFYKQVIARWTDARALPEPAQRHLQKCVACRQFFDLERELARRLVAEAELERQPVPPFLHSRIMASLERRPQTVHKSLSPVWAAALVIAMLGLVSFFLVQDSQKMAVQRL